MSDVPNWKPVVKNQTLDEREYCCDSMRRWVSNPHGANESPVESGFSRLAHPQRRWACNLNTSPFENDRDVIHCDEYENYGIYLKCDEPDYVIIKFCPWCGEELSTRDISVGETDMASDQYFAFDDRGGDDYLDEIPYLRQKYNFPKNDVSFGSFN